jgi:DNA replication protein DnaC
MLHKIKSIEGELQKQFELIDNSLCVNSCRIANKDCNNCAYLREYWWGLKQSLIPEKLYMPKPLKPEEIDIKSFEQLNEIRKGIVNFVEEGENLYLYSDNICGNGKTSWTFKLLQTYLFNCNNRFLECKGLFINVPTFMADSRFAISGNNPLFYEIVELIKVVDLVVWDDIGACVSKDYDYQNLLALVGIRDVSKLSNIFTSNLKGEDLCKAFDNRFVNRVWENSTHIELKGDGRRGVHCV